MLVVNVTLTLADMFGVDKSTDERTYGQTEGRVINKISPIFRLPFFLTHGAPPSKVSQLC